MLKVFKVKYVWYDGEGKTDYITKDINDELFEKDLSDCYKKAKKVVKNKSKKEQCVDCLPEYYDYTLDLMIKKGYTAVDVEVNETYTTYFIDDDTIQKLVYKSKFIVLEN